MADSRQLQELDCTNLSSDWKSWKRNFLVYMIANNKSGEPETTKIASFLWLIGTQGANIYNTLFPNDGSQNSLLGTSLREREIPASLGPNGEQQPPRVVREMEQRTLDEVLNKFDEHCLPQVNVTMESYKFNSLVQKENQTFNEFITELRTQLERCQFNCRCGASYENRMLRDRIITGVFDKKLQLKLLDGRDEPLESVINMCKTFESANVNKELLDGKKQITSISTDKPSNHNKLDRNQICFNCGNSWSLQHKKSCPAKNFICQCGKMGHYRRMCRSKGKNKQADGTESRVNEISWGDVQE